LNGIQIPPECRNYPRRNSTGTESAESVQCPTTLDLGVINPSFLCSSTTTTTIDDAHPPLPPHHRRLTASSRHHHHHPRPRPPTSIARNQHTMNDVAMPHHQTNEHRPRRHHNKEHNPHQKRRGNVMSPTERPRATSTPRNEGDSRCHVADCDVATKQRTTIFSSFVVALFVLHDGESSSPFVPIEPANNYLTKHENWVPRRRPWRRGSQTMNDIKHRSSSSSISPPHDITTHVDYHGHNTTPRRITTMTDHNEHNDYGRGNRTATSVAVHHCHLCGEQICFPSPQFFLTPIPGATSLSATWQPDDER
jgi:hypothetical protein